jgi:hypothetical protein
MNAHHAALRGDAGSISPFFAVAALGLLVAIGLAYDIGGTQITAQQMANAYAAEAARTGGQAINLGQAVQGNAPTLNHTAAIAAVHRYLRTAGVEGSVRFINPTTLAVEVTVRRHTVFLGLVGIGDVTANGHATARIRTGPTAGGPP